MFRFFLVCVLPACVSICYCEENDFPGGYFCNNQKGDQTKLLKDRNTNLPLYVSLFFILWNQDEEHSISLFDSTVSLFSILKVNP